MDELKCGIMYLNIWEVVIGNRYLWDRDLILQRRYKMWTFIKELKPTLSKVTRVIRLE